MSKFSWDCSFNQVPAQLTNNKKRSTKIEWNKNLIKSNKNFNWESFPISEGMEPPSKFLYNPLKKKNEKEKWKRKREWEKYQEKNKRYKWCNWFNSPISDGIDPSR